MAKKRCVHRSSPPRHTWCGGLKRKKGRPGCNYPSKEFLLDEEKRRHGARMARVVRTDRMAVRALPPSHECVLGCENACVNARMTRSMPPSRRSYGTGGHCGRSIRLCESSWMGGETYKRRTDPIQRRVIGNAECKTSAVDCLLRGRGHASCPMRPRQPHVRSQLWIEYLIHHAYVAWWYLVGPKGPRLACMYRALSNLAPCTIVLRTPKDLHEPRSTIAACSPCHESVRSVHTVAIRTHLGIHPSIRPWTREKRGTDGVRDGQRRTTGEGRPNAVRGGKATGAG